MSGSSTAIREGNWAGTVLLLNGASHMGKSFFAKTVLSSEYGTVYRQVDKIYTIAVRDADMVAFGAAASDADKRNAERNARRRARDRKWPTEETKALFFASFKKHVRQVCREGLDARSAIVIEGGSLRRRDEVKLIVRSARAIHGPEVRLVRITVEVPYDRWLQNRVNRMLKAGVESVALKSLSSDSYSAEATASRPNPHPDVLDCVIRNVDDVHHLMAELDQRRNTGDRSRRLPSSMLLYS